jgi:hypothetical protein
MQREGPASSLKTTSRGGAKQHSRPRRILYFVAALFVITVVALAGYEFLLRELHRDGGTDKESARRLRRTGSDDRTQASASATFGGGNESDGNGSGSPRDSSVDGDSKAPADAAGTKRGGYQQRKGVVALTPEQKEDRRKVLARSLLEQRAKAAADGTAFSSSVIDDDWRKDGFAQKPSWWDRYQKVQATQRAQQQEDGRGGGLLQRASSAWSGWKGTDAMDMWVDGWVGGWVGVFFWHRFLCLLLFFFCLYECLCHRTPHFVGFLSASDACLSRAGPTQRHRHRWDDDEDEDDQDYYGSSKSKQNAADPLHTIPSDCYLVMARRLLAGLLACVTTSKSVASTPPHPSACTALHRPRFGKPDSVAIDRLPQFY